MPGRAASQENLSQQHYRGLPGARQGVQQHENKKRNNTALENAATATCIKGQTCKEQSLGISKTKTIGCLRHYAA